MLLDEVAINPECVTDPWVLSALHHRFSWFQGRAVLNIPGNWKQQVLSHIKTLPDGITKERAKSLIASSLPFLEAYPSKTMECDWSALADNLARQRRISAFIDTNPSDREGWYAMDEIENYIDISGRSVGHLEIKDMDAAAVVTAVDGFLKVNKRITLINPDQWLLTSNKSSNLFTAFFKQWQAYGGIHFRVIRSMRRDKPVDAKWDDEVAKLQQFLARSNYKQRFELIAVDDDIERLHERYLIGTCFGISLGYGLELNKKPQAWSLLNEATYFDKKKQFMDNDIRDAYGKHRTWSYKT